MFEGKCLWTLSWVSDRERALCMCSPVLLVYAWCAALNVLNVHFFKKPVWISSAHWYSVIPSGVLFSLSPSSFPSFGMRTPGAAGLELRGWTWQVWLCSRSLPCGWQRGGGHYVPLNIKLWVCKGNCGFLQGRTQSIEMSINQQMFCRGKSNKRCHVFLRFQKRRKDHWVALSGNVRGWCDHHQGTVQ